MEGPSQGKRKSIVDDANKQTKKKSLASRTTTIFDSPQKTEVKKIMESLKSKLKEMSPTKLTTFLSKKMTMLEKEKKKTVGVFGKSGAGKSSLINAILGGKNLLPCGDQGACTSVMIRVEANTTNKKYIAEIEFITVEEWKDELTSILMCKSEDDEDTEDSNDDDEIITAVYGEVSSRDPDILVKMLSSKIPEFRTSIKKITCDTAEELSEKIRCFTRSDTHETFGAQFWPLVKCITVKVPNSEELLEHVVLVDLPGNGDCNKSRDEMWKKVVGDCSDVWIVSDIARASTEKEPWEIFNRTASLFGHGGECQRISFICTKTDIINDKSRILTRNKTTKIDVRDKFLKNKEIKKHFREVNDMFKVFTVSSEEYKQRRCLDEDETEIPELQKCLINLNDHRTRTSDYISGAYGILSLIQGANNHHMTDSKEEVCQILEKRLKDNLGAIGEYMEKPYEDFEKSLSKGVQQSTESWEELMDTVIAPKGKTASGYHKTVKALCQNDGIYIQKGKKNRGNEINLNGSLASTMRSCINEDFKIYFANDKCGQIREQIQEFTLDATSMIEVYKNVSLYLTFLEMEERELKAELIRELCEKKKKIYFTLTDSIQEYMRSSYKDASKMSGKDSLKRMQDKLHLQVNDGNIFKKAKEDMLDSLTKLKEHIVMRLKSELEKSIEISFKTSDNLIRLDVTEDFNKVKEFMDSSAPSTMSGNGKKQCRHEDKASQTNSLGQRE